MKIVKRNGSEVTFDVNKIVSAIERANITVPLEQRLTHEQVVDAGDAVEAEAAVCGHTVTVEEVQDMVEDQIMAKGAFSVARNYITYRYIQGLKRQNPTRLTTRSSRSSSATTKRSSRRTPTRTPRSTAVQRDYMAGEVSKDITQRILLPKDIVEAHEEGIIHFHDSDYYAQHMHNCDLVNLEDMLQNGTVISGTLIEKPHSFSTACNIATQIIAQVASSTSTAVSPFPSRTWPPSSRSAGRRSARGRGAELSELRRRRLPRRQIAPDGGEPPAR